LSARTNVAVATLITASGMLAQPAVIRPTFEAFEVATIKPTDPDYKGGRFITMQSTHVFAAKNYTVKALVVAAYNLNPRAVSGGPAWFDSDRYDIVAKAPNEIRPNLDEQMSIYALTFAKNGPKLRASTEPPDAPAALVNRIFPGRALLPARNATMEQFASMMQRAVLDRPVVDRTGLSGKYDFDLEWMPDEVQFGGQVPSGSPEAQQKPDLFAAIQQLGLRLDATKGPVEVLVINQVQRPTAN